MPTRARDWTALFPHLDIDAAALRMAGFVEHTPLAPIPCDDPRIELRAKLENRQVVGAFKARGAWNNLSQLTPEERASGIVTCSSGNHGKALAWAARLAGVKATIVMPRDAYPNKIQACRDLGATVVLSEDRLAADRDAAKLAERGLVFIHPYDRDGTIEGAGTVGVEIAEDWPEVEVVVVPVGGGGLIAGTSLALRRRLGERVTILGVEPAGAPSMTRGLEAGEPVTLETIETSVQGLCPSNSGARNIAVCLETVDGMVLLSDEEILAAQRRLVLGGEVVEPAGAAAVAVVDAGKLPGALFEGRTAEDALRVAAVVSGGNPDPAQLERVRSGG
jgi:threonine dehydratase